MESGVRDQTLGAMANPGGAGDIEYGEEESASAAA